MNDRRPTVSSATRRAAQGTPVREPEASSKASISLGIALVIVGAFFIFFAGGIRTSGLAGNGDPGPRAVPLGLSIILMLGGVFEIGASAARAHARRGRPARQKLEPARAWLRTGDKKVVVFATISLVYLLTVPYAFYTSTLVFGTLAIWYLGARWWAAFSVSSAIVLLVWLLFVRLFLVPLPTLSDTLNFY